MILVNRNLNTPISIHEGLPNILVVENKHLFFKLVDDLVKQSEGNDGEWILSEDSKIYSINKTVNVIVDYFHLNFNSKPILSKLYSNLKDISTQGDFYVDTISLKQTIAEYFEKINSEVMLPIEFSTDFDITNIFKILDVKLSEIDAELVENMNIVLHILRELTGNKLTVLVNFLDYLTEEEIEVFYRDLNYNKQSILLIERKWNRIKRENEKIFIVDDDLCEIYIDEH
ncbi:MAG TPA: type II-A CRISPR-associated protein Csn2 [Clostridia bacterium]|jgi:CRISPR-associated protein Csn2|nr:type II-A CRISPR-associated protein Csn2 [Clostridia bacterium]HQC68857.1 type II-A CRISPR-associated protein Csn2 [Clostridia bacterium]